MGWQDRFQDQVTNVAFHLTLSRRMILALEMAKAYHDGDCPMAEGAMRDFGYFVPSVRCLIDRGLVEHHNTDATNPSVRADHKWYTLTPAGELVWQMCVLAGLVKDRITMEKVA